MEQALGLPLDLVYFFVIEARLAHVHSIVILALHLLGKVKLGNMLGTAVRRREVIEILEAVLVSLVESELWPLLLQVEINEAG